jgi:iron complex transport system substrate-binding protein
VKRYPFFLLCLCVAFHAHAACVVIDDAGKKIDLAAPAKRIISLAPDLTEILFTVGASEQLAGVIEGSDYPLAAQKLPRVGNYSGIDVERILLFHPDLIVTWGNTFSRQLTVFAKQGIPIYTAESHRLEDVPRQIKNMGCLTGMQAKAADAAAHFSERLGKLKAQYSTQKKVKVFYQIGSYSLITINKDSWINQVITLCGGENVFADVKTIAPEVSWEAVVMANPQVIISDATISNWKERWQSWPEISAVKQQQLFSVNPDIVERAGPRLLNGAVRICEILDKTRTIHVKE